MTTMQLRARRNAPTVTSRHADRGVAFRLLPKHFDAVDAVAAKHNMSAGTLARLLLQDVAECPDRYQGVVERVVKTAREQEDAKRLDRRKEKSSLEAIHGF